MFPGSAHYVSVGDYSVSFVTMLGIAEHNSPRVQGHLLYWIPRNAVVLGAFARVLWLKERGAAPSDTYHGNDERVGARQFGFEESEFSLPEGHGKFYCFASRDPTQLQH